MKDLKLHVKFKSFGDFVDDHGHDAENELHPRDDHGDDVHYQFQVVDVVLPHDHVHIPNY